jgi:hypothetical protein
LLKKYAKGKGIAWYKVAEYAGISESQLYVKLRKQLTNEQATKLTYIVDTLAIGKEPERLNVFGISPHHNSGPLSDEENNKRMRLYQKGKCDREIASLEGVSTNAIASWRIARGLKPNKRPHKLGFRYDGNEQDFDIDVSSKYYSET